MNTVTPISLAAGDYTSGNSRKLFEHFADIYDDVQNGIPVYVRFKTPCDARRTGSIAKISSFGYEWDYMMNGSAYRWSGTRRVHVPYSKDALLKSPYFSSLIYSTINVRWDGRYNEVTTWPQEIEWLKGHTGGTEWVWQKPEQPKVIPHDSLNREIKVGDFVVYVLHHAIGDRGASAHFGNITKIEDNGQVWAKNVKIHDQEEVAEKRIKHNSNITILTKDLMQQLMLAKLRTI